MTKLISKKRHGRMYSIWLRFRRNTTALFGGVIIIVMIFSAIFATRIAPYDPFEINLPGKHQPPSKIHLFGTDELGRDILSRCIWGARVSLTIGIIASVITITIGITIGLVSGYYGGWIDIMLMRIVDVILAMPNFFLYILAISMFRVRGVWVIAIIMGMLNWTSLARIVRGEVLSLKERDYIVASKALGAFDWRIILVHILPNVLAPILVTTTYRMAGFILSESSLSFLGLGDPTSGSWGAVLTSGRKSLRYSPWISTFPGLMLFLTVLGFNMLGDGLRDALDPRLKR